MGLPATNIQNSELRLSDVHPGQSAIITGYGYTQPSLIERLASLGMVPGKDLKVIRASWFRDPISIELMGYNIALRSAEAHAIKVQIV